MNYKKKYNETLIEMRRSLSMLEEFYLGIKDNPRYTERLKDVFQIESSAVYYDDENYIVTVNLDRNINTYSTGEINIALFITSLFEFIQTDKKWLVMDDPISSFDLPNQYNIIFELVKLITVNNKNIAMFTHNLDVLNISKSQKVSFDYYTIESRNEFISDDIVSILSLNRVKFEKNISYKELLKRAKANVQHDESYYYLKAIKEREEEKPVLHKIFHYNGSFCEIPYPGKSGVEISNEYMFNLIEDFEDLGSFPKNTGKNVFYINSLNKILYLSGLRVWIEKKLYDYTTDKKKEDFSKFFTLHEKISLVLSDVDDDSIEKNVKESLLSKKTMLNQNSHYYSQLAPFNFALNLSIRDIEKEIIEIKKLLSSLES